MSVDSSGCLCHPACIDVLKVSLVEAAQEVGVVFKERAHKKSKHHTRTLRFMWSHGHDFWPSAQGCPPSRALVCGPPVPSWPYDCLCDEFVGPFGTLEPYRGIVIVMK